MSVCTILSRFFLCSVLPFTVACVPSIIFDAVVSIMKLFVGKFKSFCISNGGGNENLKLDVLLIKAESEWNRKQRHTVTIKEWNRENPVHDIRLNTS